MTTATRVSEIASRGVSLTVDELIGVIEDLYELQNQGVRIPLLMIGPPGIGKTAGVAEAAAMLAKKYGKILVDLTGDACRAAEDIGVKCISPRGLEDLKEIYKRVSENPDRYFVYMRIVGSQVTPEDLQFPLRMGDAILSAPPIKLAIMAVPGVSGLLFVDEITNVQRDDTKTMLFALVNEGAIGLSGQLSRNVMIVAAGNPSEVSSVAEELPAPLVNRFVVVRVRPPSARWMLEYLRKRLGDKLHPAIVAFFLGEGDSIVYQPPRGEETLENFPTPRSWERVAYLLWKMGDKFMRNKTLAYAVLSGALGDAVAAKLIKYLETNIDLDKLASNPSLYDSLEKEARLVAIAALAKRLSSHPEEAGKFANLIVHMFDKHREDLATLIALVPSDKFKKVIDALRRTPAYAKIATFLARFT